MVTITRTGQSWNQGSGALHLSLPCKQGAVSEVEQSRTHARLMFMPDASIAQVTSPHHSNSPRPFAFKMFYLGASVVVQLMVPASHVRALVQSPGFFASGPVSSWWLAKERKMAQVHSPVPSTQETRTKCMGQGPQPSHVENELAWNVSVSSSMSLCLSNE